MYAVVLRPDNEGISEYYSYLDHFYPSSLATTASSHMPFEIIPTRKLLFGNCTREIWTIKRLRCVHVLMNAALMSFEISFECES